MSARKLIRNTATTFATVVFLGIACAHAITLEAKPGEVLFRAVNDGAALLREVKWEITSSDNQLSTTDKRHTFTTELPPGEYVAKLTCNGKDYQRAFKIISPHHKVVIDCADQ